MQPLNLKEFKNSSGWHIVLKDGWWVVKNLNGNSFPQKFTTKPMAAAQLHIYLSKAEAPARPLGRPKGS